MFYLFALLFCLPFVCYPIVVDESMDTTSDSFPYNNEMIRNSEKYTKKSTEMYTGSNNIVKNNNDDDSDNEKFSMDNTNDAYNKKNFMSNSMSTTENYMKYNKDSESNYLEDSTDNERYSEPMHDGIYVSENEEYSEEEGDNESNEFSSNYPNSDFINRHSRNNMNIDTRFESNLESNPYYWKNRKISNECSNCAYARAKGKSIDECPNCFTKISGSHTDCHICKRIISHLKRLSSTEGYVEKTTKLIKVYCSNDNARFKETCIRYRNDPESFMDEIQNHINSGYVCANVGYCPRNNANMELNNPGLMSKPECELCKKSLNSLQRNLNNPFWKSSFRDKVADECWNIVTRKRINFCRSIADSIVNYIIALLDISQSEGVCVKAKWCPYSRFNELRRYIWLSLRRQKSTFPYLLI